MISLPSNVFPPSPPPVVLPMVKEEVDAEEVGDQVKKEQVEEKEG